MTRHAPLLAVLLLAAACESTPPPGTPVDPDAVPISTNVPEARRLYLSGRTNADRFKSEEARRDFLQAVKLDPEFAVAWLDLAWVAETAEARADCFDRATSLLRHASAGERLRIRAAKLENDGRLEAARRLYRQLLQMYPRDARVQLWLGMSYGMMDPSREIEHLRRAVTIDPSLDVAWNMLGYAYAWNDQLDPALDAHRRYVELLPNEPNAHDSYAENLLKAGRFEESIEEYRKALSLDPSFVWSRMGIGHNLVLLGRMDEAKAEYERAFADATTDSDRMRAAEWLVVRAIYAGDVAAARAAVERYAEIAGEMGEVERAAALRYRARVEIFAGDLEAARTLAVQARDLLGEKAPERARVEAVHAATRMLVEIEADAGNADAARALLTELKALDAAGGPPWQREMTSFEEGYLLLATGDAEGAVRALEMASDTDPRVLYWLGRAHEAAGRKTEAFALYAKIVDWNAPGLSHALVYADAKARRAALEPGEGR